jgi:hypothetical protein
MACTPVSETFNPLPVAGRFAPMSGFSANTISEVPESPLGKQYQLPVEEQEQIRSALPYDDMGKDSMLEVLWRRPR